MKGERKLDNCYHLIGENECLATKIDETMTWHKKLGHVNIRKIGKNKPK